MKEKIIVYQSRKAFFLEYIMAAVALTVLLTASFRDANGIVVFLSGAAVAVGLIVPEVTRKRNICIITPEAITIRKGLVGKREHQFHMATITDVNYNQTPWQRIWNYGTLVIRSFSHAGKNIRVGNVDNPADIMATVSRLIDQKLDKPAPQVEKK
jgi:membrane protein YdbS with pleckstrin-like domain